MNENLGFKVVLILRHNYPQVTVYRNVTEIHYAYNWQDVLKIPDHIREDRPLRMRKIAFESGIHLTGMTWALEDVIEFEVKPEIELAEAF